MMIYENIKTAVLWILILSSVVLTWLIWTYEPGYRTLQTDESEYIESEKIGEERTVSSLLLPEEVIVHQGDDTHWMQPVNHSYQQLMETIKTMDINNLHPISTARASFLENEFTGVELIFSDRLHEDWLPRLFSLSDETTKMQDVDRVILYEEENSNHAEVSIIFISAADEQLYMADTGLSVKSLKALYNGDNIRLTEVEVLELNETDLFYAKKYVPSETFSLANYTYLFNQSQLNQISEAYKRALFNDPDYVKHYLPGSLEDVYTDGNSMLSIVDNGNILRYSNPVASSQADRGERSVVEASVDFINSHSGWTGEYQLEQWRETEATDTALYRMHIKGLPVMGSNLNNQEYFTMELTRVGTHITEYNRPIYQLEGEGDLKLSTELPPYKEVVKEIEKSDAIQLEWVEDVRIGHYMEKKPSLILFTPAWFVKERGRWVRIEFESESSDDARDREVGQGGLE